MTGPTADRTPGRILVAGRHGQVARALVGAAAMADDLDVVAIGRPVLDLTDAATIARAMHETRPALVVNAAAYTAVDRAESEPDAAMAPNAHGAAHLASAAAASGVPIIHLSTDYVFDGTLGRPYREDDPVRPLGAYGRSKAAGEGRVRAATDDHVILRTSWIHAPYGANFVRTMLRLAADRDEVRVVADQRGRPTYAPDVAAAILVVARRLLSDRDRALRGTFHLAGTGEATWADLAEAVFDASRERGGPTASVARIRTADYPTPAARPADSRLDTSRFEATFDHALPDWRDGVQRCVAALAADRRTGP